MVGVAFGNRKRSRIGCPRKGESKRDCSSRARENQKRWLRSLGMTKGGCDETVKVSGEEGFLDCPNRAECRQNRKRRLRSLGMTKAKCQLQYRWRAEARRYVLKRDPHASESIQARN